MIATLLTVCRKEIIETLRERRAIVSLLFGLLLGPAVFALLINVVVRQNVSAAEDPLSIVILGAERAPNLVAFLKARNIHDVAQPDFSDFSDLDGAAAAVGGGRRDVVLVIDDQFADDFGTEHAARVTLVLDRSKNRTMSRAQRVRSAVDAYGQQIGALRLVASGGQPGLLRPLVLDEYDVSTPAGRSALLLGVLTYFLLFATLSGGLHLAIDSTAGERERKSLEPLLTLPVSRTAVLLGKMTATLFFMLVSLALTLAAFKFSLARMPLDQMGMSSSFGLRAALLSFAVICPIAPLGAALMTLIASFSKTYREAQTYLTFVLLVPTMPVMFASMLNVEPAPKLMWIPSLSQHLLVTTLIKGQPLVPSYVALSAVSSLALGALVGWLATRLYQREAILG
jgi:sodium transport system permease protein